MSDYSEDSKPPPKRRIALNDVVEFIGQNDPTFHTGILEVSAQVTKHINVINETITQSARIFKQLAKPAWLDAAESLEQRINQTIEQIARPAWMDIVQSFQKSIEQQRIDFAKIASSPATEYIIQSYRSISFPTKLNSAQPELRSPIGVIENDPRRQKSTPIPQTTKTLPKEPDYFLKVCKELSLFINAQHIRQSYFVMSDDNKLSWEIWETDRVLLRFNDWIIAWIVIKSEKELCYWVDAKATKAEIAAARLESTHIRKVLQEHLWATVGLEVFPFCKSELWKPEPLPPVANPAPPQTETVKPPDDATLPIKPDGTRYLNDLSQQEKQAIYLRVEYMKFTGNEKKIMKIHLFNELTNSKIAERVNVTEGFVKNTLSKLYKAFPETRKKPL